VPFALVFDVLAGRLAGPGRPVILGNADDFRCAY
jgi:hypothetical protein